MQSTSPSSQLLEVKMHESVIPETTPPPAVLEIKRPESPASETPSSSFSEMTTAEFESLPRDATFRFVAEGNGNNSILTQRASRYVVAYRCRHFREHFRMRARSCEFTIVIPAPNIGTCDAIRFIVQVLHALDVTFAHVSKSFNTKCDKYILWNEILRLTTLWSLDWRHHTLDFLCPLGSEDPATAQAVLEYMERKHYHWPASIWRNAWTAAGDGDFGIITKEPNVEVLGGDTAAALSVWEASKEPHWYDTDISKACLRLSKYGATESQVQALSRMKRLCVTRAFLDIMFPVFVKACPALQSLKWHSVEERPASSTMVHGDVGSAWAFGLPFVAVCSSPYYDPGDEVHKRKVRIRHLLFRCWWLVMDEFPFGIEGYEWTLEGSGMNTNALSSAWEVEGRLIGWHAPVYVGIRKAREKKTVVEDENELGGGGLRNGDRPVMYLMGLSDEDGATGSDSDSECTSSGRSVRSNNSSDSDWAVVESNDSIREALLYD